MQQNESLADGPSQNGPAASSYILALVERRAVAVTAAAISRPVPVPETFHSIRSLTAAVGETVIFLTLPLLSYRNAY